MLGNLDDIIAELIGLCASILLIVGYALYRQKTPSNNFVLHSIDRGPVDHEQLVTSTEVLREVNGEKS